MQREIFIQRSIVNFLFGVRRIDRDDVLTLLELRYNNNKGGLGL